MAVIVLRIYRIFFMFIIIGAVLILRLLYIQFFLGSQLANESLYTRVEEISLKMDRGEIMDRNGLPLINTEQEYSVILFPKQIYDIDNTAKKLASLMHISEPQLKQVLAKTSQPVKMNSTIDKGTALQIRKEHISGVIILNENMRYGSNHIASHVIGYTNIDNQGVSGVEKMYDDILIGSGIEYISAFVDARENLIPGLGYKRRTKQEGIVGNNVILTIDKQIQNIVEDTMDRHSIKGAVVILNPITGEILAMASRPGFDRRKVYDYLKKDSSPLLNRAVVAYQPGSVFKLVIAAAALEHGVVSANETFYDPGYIKVGEQLFKGWDYQDGGRGTLTFKDALAYSSNPVFIEVGLKLGGERLLTFSRKLGFGQETFTGFAEESKGNLPKRDMLYPAAIANLSIGQGELEATPLQIVRMVSAIINDGMICEPYLIKRVTNSNGDNIKIYENPPKKQVFSKETAKQLRGMMEAATKYGTGKAAFIEKYGSAGKTGSAETGRQTKTGQGISHAWFVGYTPIQKPQYAAVVFVEDGMSGGDVAAPIFSEIFKEIFSTQ